MTNFDFSARVVKYFSINKDVLEEIDKFLAHLKPDDFEALWNHLKISVSPGKRIGVADMWEACRNLNIKTRNQAGYVFPAKTVTCEVCGDKYRWRVYASEFDNKNGVYEKCPKCRFPYEDTQTIIDYENDGLNQHFGDEHRKYVKEYRARHLKGVDATKYVPFEPDVNKLVEGLRERLGIRG